MKTEELKELGIEDEELIKQIFALHGRSVEKAKADAAAFKEQAETVQKQLDEATTTINSFKEMDIDSIKAASEKWEQEAKRIAEEAEVKLKTQKFDHVLENALRDAKAKNIVAVRALLDTEKLKIAEDESIEGLEDQLKEVRSKNEYMFEDETPQPKITTRSSSRGTGLTDAMISSVRKGAGLDGD